MGATMMTIREQAVLNVDTKHGYTMEFAPDPRLHRMLYDEEERRLTIEQVITDELTFAEHLKTLDEWVPVGELIERYNNVDVACQHAMDDATPTERERIRQAMVAVRDAQTELNQRAVRTWAQRECEERRLQIVELATKIMSNVTPP